MIALFVVLAVTLLAIALRLFLEAFANDTRAVDHD
jgi:hypothetical protein